MTTEIAKEETPDWGVSSSPPIAPCPFCGAPGAIEGRSPYVECSSPTCDAYGPTAHCGDGPFDERPEGRRARAIALWNHRATVADTEPAPPPSDGGL